MPAGFWPDPADEPVEVAILDKREMQYLYPEGDGYVFMDTETYDQVTLAEDKGGVRDRRRPS